MLFAVLFTDKPGHAALRSELLAAHVQWVDQHKETILVAGSLRDEPGSVPRGGLWVVEAESRLAVQVLLATDPFHTGGLRAAVDIWHWSKALPDRQVLV